MTNKPSRPVVVFGCNTFASLGAFALQHDAKREVAGFTADRDYITKADHEGLPLIAFDEVTRHFPPDRYEMLLPLGYQRMNTLRAERVEQAGNMGYTITHFVSSRAVLQPGISVAENVLIFEQAVLQAYVQLGRNTTIRAGANIGHHGRIGDHSFVAAGVVTGGNVTIGEQCFIGLGAILRDGINIGDRCFIGAGAVIVADTEPDSVYVGNPARKLAKNSMEIT